MALLKIEMIGRRETRNSWVEFGDAPARIPDIASMAGFQIWWLDATSSALKLKLESHHWLSRAEDSDWFQEAVCQARVSSYRQMDPYTGNLVCD